MSWRTESPSYVLYHNVSTRRKSKQKQPISKYFLQSLSLVDSYCSRTARLHL